MLKFIGSMLYVSKSYKHNSNGTAANTIRLINELRQSSFILLLIRPDVLQTRESQMFV